MVKEQMDSQNIRRPGQGRLLVRDKFLVLLVLTLFFGGTISLQILRPDKPDDLSVAPVSVKPFTLSQFRGICITLQDGNDDHPFDKYIREMAATGANSVMFVLPGYQQNCDSSSIFLDGRKAPSQKRLKELVKLAHDEGMYVVLMPVVLLENPLVNEWRGKIKPGDGNDWDNWWEDYTNYILHYARIAEDTGVDLLMVGSELLSTQGQRDRWIELIAQVRERYSGFLSYSSNWDDFHNVTFWDHLDVIGMTTYHDLSGGRDKPEDITMDVLMEAWKGPKAKILEWQQKSGGGKPILFTEVGWPNQVTAAKYPWNYYKSPHSPDPTQQARCFESFFRTWQDEPGVAGYMIWDWRAYEHQETDPYVDTGYCILGKPCLDVIKSSFAGAAKRNAKGAATLTSQPLTLPATMPAATSPAPATAAGTSPATREGTASAATNAR